MTEIGPRHETVASFAGGKKVDNGKDTTYQKNALEKTVWLTKAESSECESWYAPWDDNTMPNMALPGGFDDEQLFTEKGKQVAIWLQNSPVLEKAYKKQQAKIALSATGDSDTGSRPAKRNKVKKTGSARLGISSRSPGTEADQLVYVALPGLPQLGTYKNGSPYFTQSDARVFLHDLTARAIYDDFSLFERLEHICKTAYRCSYDFEEIAAQPDPKRGETRAMTISLKFVKGPLSSSLIDNSQVFTSEVDVVNDVGGHVAKQQCVKMAFLWFKSNLPENQWIPAGNAKRKRERNSGAWSAKRTRGGRIDDAWFRTIFGLEDDT